MAEARCIGGYPVIGIRPTIDGRRGVLDVRGALEDQTMGMARAAKKLFEENLGSMSIVTEKINVKFYHVFSYYFTYHRRGYPPTRPLYGSHRGYTTPPC